MAPTDRNLPEPQRLAIRLPHWGWFLLAAVVLVVGYFGVTLYRNEAAIRALERIDGRVYRHPGGPDWLRRWLGDERMKPFDSVWQVDLDGTAATDEDIKQIAVFTKIRTLRLGETRVTSRCLYHLRGLPNLALIYLNGTQINDDGFEYLMLLPALEYLNLDNTSVSDKCLTYLKRCTRLESVSLERTQVTQAGLDNLERFKPHFVDDGLFHED